MTREVDGLIATNLAGQTGCFAGFTTNGSHVEGSYHFRPGTDSQSGPIGLAVDFDAPGTSASELLACARLFLSRSAQLAELFHTPLGQFVKDGKVYPISSLDAHDRAIHYDHVHVAVPKGTVLTVSKEQAMTIVIAPVGAVSRQGNDAYGWAFGAHGHVYAYGVAKWFGNWDDLTRNDPGRFCVALVPTISGEGYWLVSNRGETYAYGDAPAVGNYQPRWGAGEIIGAVLNTHTDHGGVTLLRDDGQHLNIYALPS